MPNCIQLGLDDLKLKKVWVRLEYGDGSQFCFETTLNSTILRGIEITLKEYHFVRLDKKYFYGGELVHRQFSFVGTKITIWSAMNYTDKRSEGVHQFL